MIRNRIAASLSLLALCAGLTMLTAAPANAETMIVKNTTSTKAWITLYRDAGIAGWAIFNGPNPGFVEPNGSFMYVRGPSVSNGPWRLRFESDVNGKRYDHVTVFWFDGAQHNFNRPGDPDSVFYICSTKEGVPFWSISPKCDRNDNR